jgi:hypothetical protein
MILQKLKFMNLILLDLETVVDEEKYQSVLFDITRSLDNQTKTNNHK